MSQLTNWKSLHGSFFEGTKTLVTGGAGFIGSHIAEALLDLGAVVTVIDDLCGGLESNLKYLSNKSDGNLRVIKKTILDEAALTKAAQGARFIFHQAALASVPASVENPLDFHKVNVDGTFHVLEAGRKASVQRVMFAASSAAYGNSPEQPKKESMPTDPISPYAANKVAGEAMMRGWAGSYEMDAVALRYFNIFGPRQNGNSAYAAVIAAFAGALISGKRPDIFGDGKQTRDFCFVDNVVQANLLAARSGKPLNGAVFNVASGTSITVTQLAKQMSAVLGREDLKPAYLPPRAGDVQHSSADLSCAKAILAYNPVVDFAHGLKTTVNWYKQQNV